jgi:hypothetical protein
MARSAPKKRDVEKRNETYFLKVLSKPGLVAKHPTPKVRMAIKRLKRNMMDARFYVFTRSKRLNLEKKSESSSTSGVTNYKMALNC